MARTKDIQRHRGLLDDRSVYISDQKTSVDRHVLVKAMKSAWVAGRASNPNAAITNPQQQALLRIMAAELGLIDPDQ